MKRFGEGGWLMRVNDEAGRVDTTLGDLIAAVSDAAFESDGDERGAYLLASLALEVILKRAVPRLIDSAGLTSESSPDLLFH